eukprot:SM000028S10108  [mRNA]  locus=s28:452935:453921:+ [translate_table: standard]
MGVFQFVCREEDGQWTAKRHGGEEGAEELTAEADSTFGLGRKLVGLAVANSPGGGGVSSFFSLVTPSSGVYEAVDMG